MKTLKMTAEQQQEITGLDYSDYVHYFDGEYFVGQWNEKRQQFLGIDGWYSSGYTRKSAQYACRKFTSCTAAHRCARRYYWLELGISPPKTEHKIIGR